MSEDKVMAMKKTAKIDNLDKSSKKRTCKVIKHEPPFVAQMRRDRQLKKNKGSFASNILSDDLRELYIDFETCTHNPDVLTKCLAANGVIIVTGVLSKSVCDDISRRIGEVIETLSYNASLHDLSTWKRENMLPQTASGAFSRGIGNSQPVWDVRTNPRVGKVYEWVYGTDDLVSSIDMVTWKPYAEPYHNPYDNDWAHTDNANMFEQCVQGQVVMTNTTAAFVCSPRSHLICTQLLGFRRKHNINENMDDRLEARRMVEKVGGKFQVPIIVPAGSVIIWLSSTLHSAKMVDRPVVPYVPSKADPWYGYRSIVYLTFKPRVNVSTEELSNLKSVFLRNGTTRHDGTEFPVTSFDLIQEKNNIVYHPRIREIYNDYVVDGKPLPNGVMTKMTPEINRLLGNSFTSLEIEHYNKCYL